MAKIALQGNDAGTGTLTLQAPVTNLNRNLVLPDVDGTLSTMEQVKLPIGSFMWFTGTVAPEAFIVADGELRSRAAFPDLWAFAQASGNISVDDASWTFGQYSPGDGSTTFRVPKVDDRFIRGKSGTRAVGLVEEDQMQRIIGELLGVDAGSGIHSGVFSTSAIGARATGNVTPRYDVTFDSALSPNARTSDTTDGETRPKALTMLPCIKAYDVISDPNVLNAVEVVNSIAENYNELNTKKLNKDENIDLGVSAPASGTAVDFVGIPEGVKRITISFRSLSTNGASVPIIQGGRTIPESSNYNSAGAQLVSTITTAEPTNGFAVVGVTAGVLDLSGICVLQRLDNTNWAYSCVVNRMNSAGMNIAAGHKGFASPIDMLRITTVNGTDQFDAGTINISWEF